MSKFDDFIRNNRDKFDTREPSSQVWSNIQAGLNNPPASPGTNPGSGTSPGGSGFFGKMSTFWKAAVTAIVGIGTGIGIYLAATSGHKADAPQANAPEPPSLNTEVVYEMAAVQPPVENVDVAFQEFKVNANKGDYIVTATGTEITVPEAAFVDQEGKPVTGKVNLKYREFHDGPDILASGIPMKVRDGEDIHDFQTAGMMEIRGFQGDKPVYIAPGKQLDIALASFTDEDDHRLYSLNTATGEWTDIGQAAIRDNSKKKEAMGKLPAKPAKPLRPKKAKEVEEHTFDFAVDYQDFPELKPFRNIVWHYTDVQYMEKNEWAFAVKWSKIQLKPKDEEQGLYTLELSNKKRKFEVTVTPVLDGEDYQKAMARFKENQAQYELLAAQREKELDRLRLQADLQRTFSIGQFGIYNCDRFYRFPDVLALSPEFELGGEDLAVVAKNTTIYHVTGNSRVVIPYNMKDPGRFQFSRSEDNCLVAILPGNKVGILSKDDFRKIDFRKVGVMQAYRFKLKIMDATIQSVEDIRQLIDA